MNTQTNRSLGKYSAKMSDIVTWSQVRKKPSTATITIIPLKLDMFRKTKMKCSLYKIFRMIWLQSERTKSYKNDPGCSCPKYISRFDFNEQTHYGQKDSRRHVSCCTSCNDQCCVGLFRRKKCCKKSGN